ncbi:15165_t:CDS:1, partial [Rhizophagus irregularis]
KEISHQTFCKAIQTINTDQKASSDLHNFTQKLLNNCKKARL